MKKYILIDGQMVEVIDCGYTVADIEEKTVYVEFSECEKRLFSYRQLASRLNNKILLLKKNRFVFNSERT